MPINEVEQGYNKALENKIQRFWQEQNIYNKTSKQRENKPRYHSWMDHHTAVEEYTWELLGTKQ